MHNCVTQAINWVQSDQNTSGRSGNIWHSSFWTCGATRAALATNVRVLVSWICKCFIIPNCHTPWVITAWSVCNTSDVPLVAGYHVASAWWFWRPYILLYMVEWLLAVARKYSAFRFITFYGTVIIFAGSSYIPDIVSMGSVCCMSHINSSWYCCNCSVISLNPITCATASKNSPMCDWVHAYPKATILCCSDPSIATDMNHPPMSVVSVDFRRVCGWLYYNNQQHSERRGNNCSSNCMVDCGVHF